jgi:hypothetical protein
MDTQPQGKRVGHLRERVVRAKNRGPVSRTQDGIVYFDINDEGTKQVRTNNRSAAFPRR